MGDPIGFRTLAVLTSVLEIGGTLFEQKEAGLIVNGADFNLANALANVNGLPTTYGVTEALISALFTWFMFWQATKLKVGRLRLGPRSLQPTALGTALCTGVPPVY